MIVERSIRDAERMCLPLPLLPCEGERAARDAAPPTVGAFTKPSGSAKIPSHPADSIAERLFSPGSKPQRMKKIAILQPNYLPWKGVFDLISRVDVFVFYDDVQYTAKDWRSRNRIRTPHGDIWLTVPVLTKGRRDQRICDAVIDPRSNWQTKHYKALKANYQKARHFKEYEYLLKEIYLANTWTKISELNIFATKLLAGVLGI